MSKSRWANVVVAVLALAAGTAFAKDWHKVADLSAGGDAKEVTVNREISAIRLVAETATVNVQTVVVREGANKTPYTVAARLPMKDNHDIKLPSKVAVSGLRISDAGRGAYAVYVK